MSSQDPQLIWDAGSQQPVARGYEIRWMGGDRVIAELESESQHSHYQPLDRPTLPEELAGLVAGDEAGALAFTARNGFLELGPAQQPLSYVWREARHVRTVLTLARALQLAGGDDRDSALEQTLVDLIGESTYAEFRHPRTERTWVRVTWRVEGPTLLIGATGAAAAVLPNFARASITAPTWARGSRDWDGITLDPDEPWPVHPEPRDRGSQGAIARFVVSDIVNAIHARGFPLSPFRHGASITRTLTIDGHRLRSVTTSTPLINAIFWMLENTVTGDLQVRLCELQGCGRLFVARDPRQIYCTARFDERESTCGRRARMRRLRSARSTHRQKGAN